MSIETYMQAVGDRARAAVRAGASASTQLKNEALKRTAQTIDQQRADIIQANEQDQANAQTEQLADALVDRLILNNARIDAMIESLHQVVGLDDPVGAIDGLRARPSGIQVGKMRVPIGTIGIIYESRPNVTIEAASLCLKSGNVAILRGGSEALHSNQALARALHQGIQAAGLPSDIIQVLETTDRSAVDWMVGPESPIDVIIPRGGKGLIERISQMARVPVIKHLDGVCHVYIDQHADPDMAVAIAVNAKTHRYGTCNTLETLLVHETQIERLNELFTNFAQKGVEIRACAQSLPFAQSTTGLVAQAAQEDDWTTEYLAPVLAVRVVKNLPAAIDHINRFGSGHTDTIVTQNHGHAMQFLREVDSSSVMVNASTRFADGFEYGLGAEIGISTNKLHARGPVGLEGLTTQKYLVLGNGQIRT